MSTLKKTALKYALICGVLLVVAHLFLDFIDAKPLINFNALFIDLVLIFGFVFFACKEFKEYQNGGILHFWQGISIGMIIISIGVVIFTVFLATYYTINEAAFQDYIVDAMNLFEKQRDNWTHLTDEEFALQKEGYRQTTVAQLVRGKFFTKLIVGFLTVPLVAIVLRKQN